MSQVLVLEPVGGIAGDMCLAALLHLGQRLGCEAELWAALEQGLAALAAAAGPQALELAAVRVERSAVEVNGISALHVDVVVPEAAQQAEPHHRPFRVIRALLDRAAIPADARDLAQRTFRLLAEAEGRVHGLPPDDVEFHEVGALDSIVDVTGTALLLAALGRRGVTRVLCLPPPSGGGTTRSAHGVLPVPPPATLEVLRGRVLRPSGPGERTTPTGAAIVAALTEHASALPRMVIEAAGYGAGTKRWEDAPNLLRAVLGTLEEAPEDDVLQLEANLDDLSPQVVAAALQALLAAGALDAWLTPVTMKKGRPGLVLSALCAPGLRAALEEVFFRETTTLGLRAFAVQRTVLRREFAEVQTAYGPVRVKLGFLRGALANAAPEFEDCAHAAREHGAPVKDVLAAAITAFWSGRRG